LRFFIGEPFRKFVQKQKDIVQISGFFVQKIKFFVDKFWLFSLFLLIDFSIFSLEKD